MLKCPSPWRNLYRVNKLAAMDATSMYWHLRIVFTSRVSNLGSLRGDKNMQSTPLSNYTIFLLFWK